MGVPYFFKWLRNKYPKAVEKVEENSTSGFQPGENDCLYIDMNGLIHNATHGKGSMEEIKTSLFAHLDKVIGFVNPQYLLMIAIDGVAPRAKMNQQRARRFQSNSDKSVFDSNSITPGTKFMAEVSVWISEYIADRTANNESWKNLAVVFSDCNVVGEGEHKILDFIRAQQQYAPLAGNARSHVIYGDDADLIFLGLATHLSNLIVLKNWTDNPVSSNNSNKDQLFPACPNLFVRDLPATITADKFREAFEGAGDIKSINLICDEATMTPQGYGFVEFYSTEAASYFAETLTGLEIDGETIMVRYARPFPLSRGGNANARTANLMKDTLKVANLSFSMTEDELADAFAKYGQVIQARIVTDQANKSRGFGFVQFDNNESAAAALEMNNQNIGGRRGRVEIATRKNNSGNLDVVQEKILHFLTYVKTKSNQIAYKFLEANEWDVAKALQVYVGLGGDLKDIYLEEAPLFDFALPWAYQATSSGNVTASASAGVNFSDIVEANQQQKQQPKLNQQQQEHTNTNEVTSTASSSSEPKPSEPESASTDSGSTTDTVVSVAAVTPVEAVDEKGAVEACPSAGTGITVDNPVKKGDSNRQEVFRGYYLVRMSHLRQYLQFEFDWVPSHALLTATTQPVSPVELDGNNDSKPECAAAKSEIAEDSNTTPTSTDNSSISTEPGHSEDGKEQQHVAPPLSDTPSTAIPSIVVASPHGAAKSREKEDRDKFERTGLACELNRLIDDFVFLCFMAGNDFVPGLPSIDILKGSIDTLLLLYKLYLINNRDSAEFFLTKDAQLNWPNVLQILQAVSRKEMKSRQIRGFRPSTPSSQASPVWTRKRDGERENKKAQAEEQATSGGEALPAHASSDEKIAESISKDATISGSETAALTIVSSSTNTNEQQPASSEPATPSTAPTSEGEECDEGNSEKSPILPAKSLDANQQQNSNSEGSSPSGAERQKKPRYNSSGYKSNRGGGKFKKNYNNHGNYTNNASGNTGANASSTGTVGLGESVLDKINATCSVQPTPTDENGESKITFKMLKEEMVGRKKGLYYRENLDLCHSKESTPNAIKALARHILKGYQWILQYYLSGCCSWKWFYPFHFTPYPSDLAEELSHILQEPNGVEQLVSFEKGDPFTPYQQLVAVLPRESVDCLPAVFRELILNIDSPITDFYQANFETAKGIHGLPILEFIDENRLLAAVRPLEEKIESSEEGSRNVNHTSHDLFNVAVGGDKPVNPVKISNQDINALVVKNGLFSSDRESPSTRLGFEDLCGSAPNFNKRYRK